jgi:hypothetical protein
MVQPLSGTTQQDAQRAFFSLRGNNTTEVVLQVNVPQAGGQFGVLVPAPVQPTLATTPVSTEELDVLDMATRPEIYPPSSSSGGGGCGCGTAADGSSKNLASEGGVSVGQVAQLGPVTAVTLTADTGADLTTWLTANGFVVPAASQAVVDGYAGTGRWFVAMKRNTTTGSTAATAVGVRFTLAGDHREYAIRMAAMGAAAEVAITVFIVAPQGVGPSNPYAGLTLNDLDKTTLKGPGYREALRKAVATAGGHAFVVEGIHDAAIVRGSTLAGLVDLGSRLTRLTTVMTPAQMDYDVVFNAAPPANPPTMLYLTSTGAVAGGNGVKLAGAFSSDLGMLLGGVWLALFLRSAWKKPR